MRNNSIDHNHTATNTISSEAEESTVDMSEVPDPDGGVPVSGRRLPRTAVETIALNKDAAVGLMAMIALLGGATVFQVRAGQTVDRVSTVISEEVTVR